MLTGASPAARCDALIATSNAAGSSRDHTFVCPICGQPQVQHQPGVGYRSIEVASEPLTNEKEWKAVPDGTVYSVDPDFALRFEPLDLTGAHTGRPAASQAD